MNHSIRISPPALALALGLAAIALFTPQPTPAQTTDCATISDTNLPNSEATVCQVTEGWALQPSSLTSGDRFRLLLMTSNNIPAPGGPASTRPSNAGDISFYNGFVQDRVSSNGHASIRAYSSHFRALVSTMAADTTTVDARDNTHSNSSSGNDNDGAGVPIYWLGVGNNERVAPDYVEFYRSTGSGRGWEGTGAARQG